jgi:colanic acid/amylovoran biosynthesis glycosyltransferase
LLASVTLGARLAHRARTNGWHHVHAHICSAATDIALFAHLLSGITYSVTLHSSLDEVGPNQAEKWRHASFAIAVSRTLLKEAQQTLCGALPARIDTAPMGVDVETFCRTRGYVPWNGEGAFRIFSCGRLNPGKGHGDLIAAVALLRARGIDAHLRIAGEDRDGGTGYRKTLENEIAAHGLDDVVVLLGAMPEESVRRELEAAHVFALASVNEALGVATMEAMACCMPVVVTRVGGVPELVTDGQDGLLAQSQSPDDVADKLATVACNPDLALRFGEAARRKIRADFHDGRSAETLVRMLAEVPGALVREAEVPVSGPRPIPTCR